MFGPVLQRETSLGGDGSQPANRTGMRGDIRASMERAFQADFSTVRIHAGSSMATSLGAIAFASGNDVHFAPGRYAPDSLDGRRVLGHELAHVVQQREGRVPATVHAMGVAINSDPALERSADEQGTRAARGDVVRTGRFLAPCPHDSSGDVAQGFGLLEVGLIVGGGLLAGKLIWNYYHSHYRGYPKSEEELLADRIASDPQAKQEVQGLLHARVGPGQAMTDENAFVYAEARDRDLGITAQELSDPSKPFAPQAIAELREFVRFVSGPDRVAPANDFVDVLTQQIGALTRGTDRDKYVGAILAHFHRKAQNRFLAHQHTRLPAALQTTGLDERQIDHRFLADASLLEMVGHLVDGHMARAGLVETRRADQLLADVQGRSPLEKFYALARYLVNNGGTSSATQRQINDTLRARLIQDVTAYLLPVPPARRIDNVDRFVFASILDSVTRADVPRNSAILPTAALARQEIETAVSGAVIAHAGVVSLIAHDSLLFRPYYSSREVHAKVRTSAATLRHEYGHFLEDRARVTRWLQLQQMLHQRAGGRQLKSIWPFITIPFVVSTDELQYAAVMPAWWDQGGWFGYSAKYYSSGSTELTSTVLEVFANRRRIINVALTDPELFIAVLKIIRE